MRDIHYSKQGQVWPNFLGTNGRKGATAWVDPVLIGTAKHEANSRTAGQQIPIHSLRCSQKPANGTYRDETSPNSHAVHYSSILTLSHLQRHSSNKSRLLHLGWPSKILYVILASPMRATCSAYLLLDLITQGIFDEEGKLWKYAIFSSYSLPIRNKYSHSKLISPVQYLQYQNECSAYNIEIKSHAS
jgi:hypothetical protein